MPAEGFAVEFELVPFEKTSHRLISFLATGH